MSDKKKVERKPGMVTVTLPESILIPIGGGRMEFNFRPGEHANPAQSVVNLLLVSGRAGNDHATSQGEAFQGKSASQKRKRDIESVAYMVKLAEGTTRQGRTVDAVLQYVRAALRQSSVNTQDMKSKDMTKDWCLTALKGLGKDPEAYWALVTARVVEIQKNESEISL